MLDGISQCWQVTWSAQAMNATQSCCWERETKICHSAKNSTSNRKFTKYGTKLELSFCKDEGRNIHSAGFSALHLCRHCDPFVIQTIPGISHQHTPYTKLLGARPQKSKIITHCASSKAGTQFKQESNRDVKFFSRNSHSKEILPWL